jgi:hypothetical protein
MITTIRLSDETRRAGQLPCSVRVLLATEIPRACSPKLDRTTQISGLKKLKLASCASAVAWVELFAKPTGSVFQMKLSWWVTAPSTQRGA